MKRTIVVLICSVAIANVTSAAASSVGSQVADSAHHMKSVSRDFNGDLGADVLAEHYAAAHSN